MSYVQSSAVEEDHAEHASMSNVNVNTATSTLIELKITFTNTKAVSLDPA